MQRRLWACLRATHSALHIARLLFSRPNCIRNVDLGPSLPALTRACAAGVWVRCAGPCLLRALTCPRHKASLQQGQQRPHTRQPWQSGWLPAGPGHMVPRCCWRQIPRLQAWQGRLQRRHYSLQRTPSLAASLCASATPPRPASSATCLSATGEQLFGGPCGPGLAAAPGWVPVRC